MFYRFNGDYITMNIVDSFLLYFSDFLTRNNKVNSCISNIYIEFYTLNHVQFIVLILQ